MDDNKNMDTLEDMLDKLDAKLSNNEKEVFEVSKDQIFLKNYIEDTPGDFEELNETKPKNDEELLKESAYNLQKTGDQIEIREFTEEEKKQKFENFMSNTNNDIYSDSNGVRGPKTFKTGEFQNKESYSKKIKSFRDMTITESQVEQFHQFQKQRLKIAQKFNFKRNTLNNSSRIRPLYAIDANSNKNYEKEPDPLIVNDQTDEIEYRSKSDFEDVANYIIKFKNQSKLITLGLGILFIISFIWQICLLNLFDLPLDLTVQRPVTYLTINLLFLVVASVMCYDTLSSGFMGILNRKANSDTTISFMIAGNLIQIACLFFSGALISNEKNVFVLTPVAIGCMFFHYIGKYMLAKRTAKNFKIINSKKNAHYAVGIVSNEDLSSAFIRGTTKNKPIVGYNRKTKFLTDFMYYSFLEDITDNVSYFLAPIGLCFAFILACISVFILGNFWSALTIFAVTLCMISTFSYSLSVNVPLSSAQKRLQKYSSALLGYEAANEFGKMNAIITSAIKLFPKGTVSLEGMKVFNKHPIDDSIICAASVLSITKSVLKDMFMEIIQDNEKCLGQVDSVLYEDFLGISAWVNDRRVIVGNYDMMVNHNVDMPNISELKKLERSKNCDIIFVAISGELTAAFMYKVTADPKITEALDLLDSEGVLVVVQTVDSMITSKKLSQIFGANEKLFKILSAHYHEPYRKQTKHMDKDGSPVINKGDFISFAKGVIESKKLFLTSRIGITLSIIGIFISILILILCMSTNMIMNFSALNITIFQLFCAFVVSMVTFVRK